MKVKRLTHEDLSEVGKTLFPQEDAWAYTRENREAIERALRDGNEGRVSELTEADLDRLASEDTRDPA